MSTKPTLDPTLIGPRIRLLRRQLGYSLRELAKDTGMSFQFIHMVETGAKAIPPLQLGIFATALRTSKAALTTSEFESPPALTNEEFKRAKFARKSRDYYYKGEKFRRQSVRAQRSELLTKVKSVPCADCDQTYPPFVMDLDHIRGKKVREVSQIKELSALKLEIAKCEVVCANCHRLRTHKRMNSDVVAG